VRANARVNRRLPAKLVEQPVSPLCSKVVDVFENLSEQVLLDVTDCH
jgi:hypothetical protein